MFHMLANLLHKLQSKQRLLKQYSPFPIGSIPVATTPQPWVVPVIVVCVCVLVLSCVVIIVVVGIIVRRRQSSKFSVHWFSV